MGVLEWVTAIALVIGIGMAGVTKLMANAMSVEMAKKLDYENLMKPIGGAEVLGAIGVLIGAISSDFEWVGVLAGLGIIAMMVGAVIYHMRANDQKGAAPAVVLGVVALLYIIALFGN